MSKLSSDARELLEQVEETCQEANDNLEGRELAALSAALQDLITRWRAAWRSGD